MLFSGKINPGDYFTHRIIEKFFYSALHILALLATDQQVDVAEVRTGPQQFLHQHFAHESSCSSDQHVGAPVELLDFGTPVELLDGSDCVTLEEYVTKNQHS
jgi:hypothetical protein